jgi:hypothetical protein
MGRVAESDPFEHIFEICSRTGPTEQAGRRVQHLNGREPRLELSDIGTVGDGVLRHAQFDVARGRMAKTDQEFERGRLT